MFWFVSVMITAVKQNSKKLQKGVRGELECRGSGGKFAHRWENNLLQCWTFFCTLSQRLVTFFNIIKDEMVKYITVLPIIGVGV